jgi:hypothetical protein
MNMTALWEKPGLKTVLYYLIVCPIVFYFVKCGKFLGGPCGIGLDFVAFFFAGVLSIILLTVSIVLMFMDGKRYLPSFFIHIAAVITWAILFNRM